MYAPGWAQKHRLSFLIHQWIPLEVLLRDKNSTDEIREKMQARANTENLDVGARMACISLLHLPLLA